MPDVFDWRTAVAQRVCTLVRDERVRNAFQAQCAAFIDEIDRDEERLIAWRKRRKEHCLRGSHTLAELKARTADGERLDKNPEALERTRPAEDTDKRWIFDYYQDHLDLEDLARLGSPTGEPMLVGFCVWVPPDLSLAASPKLTAPLLFARFMGASAVPTLLTLPELWRLTGTLHSSLGTTVEPGRASWAEKYASLAAIHDAQFPDRAPIDELHYINAGKLTNELRRRARQRVRQFVDALPDAVSTNVLEWLADVEADLAEHVESPGRPNRTGGEQGGEVASLEPQGAVRPTEMPETGLQSRYAMPTIRLFELLIKLRTDQLDRESAWSKAIRARAKVIAKRAKRALTDAQRELIAKVDAGHLPPTGQDTPDGRWSDGLKEIDEQAYLFYQHRGDPESPACQILAENDLKRRNAPEWRRLEGNRFLDGAVWRFRTTPWRFVVGKLQAERGMPFTEVELFEAVRLLQLEEAEDVPLAIRQFIAQQDDSGYTNELLAGLWAQYRADAEAMRLEGPEETPVGGEMAAPAVERGRQAKTSPGAAGGEPEKPLIPFPNPSAPMSKKDAADAWGGGMTVKKLSGLMESKKVRYVELNRETFVFCRDDIPNLPTR